MFRKGDRVKCIYDGVPGGFMNFLEINKNYTVEVSINGFSGEQYIQVCGSSYEWIHTRFILDIKETRKQKLKKIYESVC